jgi:NTE family protein
MTVPDQQQYCPPYLQGDVWRKSSRNIRFSAKPANGQKNCRRGCIKPSVRRGNFDPPLLIFTRAGASEFRRRVQNNPEHFMDKAEKQVLVLQGGGALGSYQAGAYEALAEADHEPDWVAGISIGAINAALIAGNPPAQRVARLRAFWEKVTSSLAATPITGLPLARGLFNEISAASSALTGVPGFFRPRLIPAAFLPAGAPGANSHMDTAPLRQTLLELVDFERLNSGEMRFSVGAVNVATGNMTWFDSAEQQIGPEHIMASGALPPGFAPAEIDGAFYWDGGLVSNTPLQYVLDERMPVEDVCVYQVDLFSARGKVPTSVWEIEQRLKDIRFSSRTRFNTDMMRRLLEVKAAGQRLYDKLPEDLRDDADAQTLLADHADPAITIVHLIYRQPKTARASKDYEFSRVSMREHWAAGRADVVATLGHSHMHARKAKPDRIKIFDLTRPKDEQHES